MRLYILSDLLSIHVSPYFAFCGLSCVSLSHRMSLCAWASLFPALTTGAFSVSHRTQESQALCKEKVCQKNAHSQGPQVAWPATSVTPPARMPESLPELQTFHLTQTLDHHPGTVRAGEACSDDLTRWGSHVHGCASEEVFPTALGK